MEMINLRPHHLMCIQKYTGHGYDEKFTIHMDQLTESIKKNPGLSIKLHEGCDYLCSQCPFNKEQVCLSDDKVSVMDRNVLESCRFAYGEEGFWETFANKVLKDILHTEEFDRICGNCQWYDLCKSTEV